MKLHLLYVRRFVEGRKVWTLCLDASMFVTGDFGHCVMKAVSINVKLWESRNTLGLAYPRFCQKLRVLNPKRSQQCQHRNQGALGRLSAWHLPGGPIGPPARWATTSNVEW